MIIKRPNIIFQQLFQLLLHKEYGHIGGERWSFTTKTGLDSYSDLVLPLLEWRRKTTLNQLTRSSSQSPSSSLSSFYHSPSSTSNQSLPNRSSYGSQSPSSSVLSRLLLSPVVESASVTVRSWSKSRSTRISRWTTSANRGGTNDLTKWRESVEVNNREQADAFFSLQLLDCFYAIVVISPSSVSSFQVPRLDSLKWRDGVDEM